jgi:hypothetical protein
VAMIRPTDYNGDKKQDMLLFNQDWELEGISSNLIATIGIPPNTFSKFEGTDIVINLLCIAPKLI